MPTMRRQSLVRHDSRLCSNLLATRPAIAVRRERARNMAGSRIESGGVENRVWRGRESSRAFAVAHSAAKGAGEKPGQGLIAGAAVRAVSAPVARQADAFSGSGRYDPGPQKAVIHMQPCKFSQHRPEMAIHAWPPFILAASSIAQRARPIAVSLKSM